MLDTELTIRCRNKESESFKMDIGIPQGDGLSSIELTLYLSNALNKQGKYRDELQQKDKHIRLNLEYADDTLAVTTDNYTVTHIKSTIRPKLENRNLQVSETKTEECEIKNHGIDHWKNLNY